MYKLLWIIISLCLCACASVKMAKQNYKPDLPLKQEGLVSGKVFHTASNLYKTCCQKSSSRKLAMDDKFSEPFIEGGLANPSIMGIFMNILDRKIGRGEISIDSASVMICVIHQYLQKHHKQYADRDYQTEDLLVKTKQYIQQIKQCPNKYKFRKKLARELINLKESGKYSANDPPYLVLVEIFTDYVDGVSTFSEDI